MISIFIERFKFIGKIPLCNGIPERALHIGDFCFPLCYRCMFVVLSFFVILCFHIYMNKRMNFKLTLLCLVPMIVDGCLQTFFFVESTNIRRSITGMLFGVGLGTIVSYVYLWIDQRTL